jgi:hypothetical protein
MVPHETGYKLRAAKQLCVAGVAGQDWPGYWLQLSGCSWQAAPAALSYKLQQDGRLPVKSSYKLY